MKEEQVFILFHLLIFLRQASAKTQGHGQALESKLTQESSQISAVVINPLMLLRIFYICQCGRF